MTERSPQSLTPQRRSARNALLAAIAIALVCAAVFFLGSSSSSDETAEAVDRSPVSAADCLSLSRSKLDAFDGEGMRRAVARTVAACRAAYAEKPDDQEVAVALAKALPISERAEILALLRKAAAQDNAEAHYQLYEQHKSWDGHAGTPDLVPRAEAERGLRRAAELGHAYSTMMLATLLNRGGGPLKRNPAEARLWAARAVENPPAETTRASLLVFLSRLLSQSEDAADRGRGREMLEKIVASGGPYNAKTALARVVRADDPVRARQLLESALRPDPGGATPPLADMLIKGEGGPADPTRAVKLLQSVRDVGAVRGALGRLYLEGKLVPRDIPKAIEMIRHEGVWDVDAQTEAVHLLAVHPEVEIDHPNTFLYDAIQAADLDEPGALSALIDLRLSGNSQFRDPTDGCRWMVVARSRKEALSEIQKAACPGN